MGREAQMRIRTQALGVERRRICLLGDLLLLLLLLRPRPL